MRFPRFNRNLSSLNHPTDEADMLLEADIARLRSLPAPEAGLRQTLAALERVAPFHESAAAYPKRAWNRGQRAGYVSLSTVLFLLCGGVYLWHRANVMTPVVIPTPTLPSPNGYDLIVKAGDRILNEKQIGNALSNEPQVFNNTNNKSDARMTALRKDMLLNENAEALRLLRQGLQHRFWNPPARSYTTLFPELAKERSLARLLILESQVFAGAGKWNRAANSQLDALQLGAEVPKGGVLIADLVGIACQAIGRKPLWKTLEHLDAAQTQALIKRLETIEAHHFTFAETLQEEKWFGQAGMLETLKSSDWTGAFAMMALDQSGDMGLGDDPPKPPPINVLAMRARLLFVGKQRILDNYTDYMDRSIEQARQPYALHRPPPTPPDDPVNRTITPIFAQARLKELAGSVAQNRLLLVTLALHAYRLEHSRYPKDISELAPHYLAQVPEDPFALHAPLRLHHDGSKCVAYSIGPDGHDDSGKPIYDAKKKTSSNESYPYSVEERSIGDIVAGINLN